MRISFEAGIVIILFLLVIFYASFGGAGYVPYNKLTNFEAFEDFPEAVNGTSADSSSIGVLGVFEANGLQASLYEEEKIIDKMSQLPSSTACIGNSSGLTNSLGGICLDQEMKTQMSTRGGNSIF